MIDVEMAEHMCAPRSIAARRQGDVDARLELLPVEQPGRWIRRFPGLQRLLQRARRRFVDQDDRDQLASVRLEDPPPVQPEVTTLPGKRGGEAARDGGRCERKDRFVRRPVTERQDACQWLSDHRVARAGADRRGRFVQIDDVAKMIRDDDRLFDELQETG
ncbi:MAG: hypothetical protein Q7J32_17730 [Sphingomonadaceae bacterium]|nr:hypothetical protein [Sphingomonadaceae bacterium]